MQAETRPLSWRLHHVGIVVRKIASAADDLVKRQGYVLVSPVIHDPHQTAHVQFLRLGNERSLLELVMPDGPESRLARAAKEHPGPHHLCYAVADIERACSQLRDQGCLVLEEPVPAVAFPGRRIAWLMDKHRMLTELVEEGEDRWEPPHAG